MTLFQGLNQPQKEAVSYLKGPLLILAGAGSGKTKVLTHRLAFLLKKGIKPEQILAVTFTNKAADEMKKRISRLAPGQPDLPFLGTFHSMANKILRRELNKSGLPWSSSFGIFDEDDAKRLIGEIIREKELPEDRFSVPRLRELISQAKQERIGPDQLTGEEFWQEELRATYQEYQQRMIKNNLMDFDDLLEVSLQLLEQHSEIRKRYQEKFRHILVDEYQDTNLAQYQMIKLLVNQDQNLMVVGDDWQSIYGFRGADFRNILNFKQDYPQAKVVKLEQNYRSSQNILQAAQEVIEHNSQRSEKRLWSARKKGEKINLFKASTGEEEALFLASKIQELSHYPETVVLYRTHAQSRLLEEALLSYQIPYQIIGGVRFYQRKEIKDVIAYLWLAKGDSPIHLARAVNTPRRGIGVKTVELLRKKGWNLEKIAQPRVKAFLKLIRRLRDQASKKTVNQLIEWLLKELDFQNYLSHYSATKEEAESRWENAQELKTVASKYQDLKPQESLRAFLEEVALMDFQDELDQKRKRVTLMTIHNVKGLEFDNVFIAGLEDGLFPHQRSLESATDLEEERRLCYVGMTRARDCLYLSWAQSRALFGKLAPQDPSRFLAEISERLLEKVEPEELDQQPQATRSHSEIREGELIEHFQLGQGRVVGVDDQLIEVEFPKLGRKKLALEYAPIRKVRERR